MATTTISSTSVNPPRFFMRLFIMLLSFSGYFYAEGDLP